MVKIVEVVWQDTRKIDHAWRSEIDDLKPALYKSVGYLIDESNTCLVIAQGILPKMDKLDEEAYRNVLVIPKPAVLDIIELKKEMEKENES